MFNFSLESLVCPKSNKNVTVGAVAKFKFARSSSAAPQRPGAPAIFLDVAKVREMVPRALVRALIAVFPGASSPLPTPACGAAARDAGSLCHRSRRAPVAFSRSGSLTVWARTPFPGRERPILVRQAPLYFLPVSPVGGGWEYCYVVVRTSDGESSSRSYRILFALGAGAPMSAARAQSPDKYRWLRVRERAGAAVFAVAGAARRGTFCGRGERWRCCVGGRPGLKNLPRVLAPGCRGTLTPKG